jgi:hypothetical protein
LIEVVLEEEEAAVEVAEEAEQEEPDALFVATSNKATAGLVQYTPFLTIYRTRMNTRLQTNLAKD